MVQRLQMQHISDAYTLMQTPFDASVRCNMPSLTTTWIIPSYHTMKACWLVCGLKPIPACHTPCLLWPMTLSPTPCCSRPGRHSASWCERDDAIQRAQHVSQEARVPEEDLRPTGMLGLTQLSYFARTRPQRFSEVSCYACMVAVAA